MNLCKTEQEKVVYDLILFDLDGTLSDSSDLIAVSLQFDYKFATGKESISIQQIKDELISGNLYDELCKMIGRKIDQEEYNKILEAHIQNQAKIYSQYLRLFDGALSLLNKLKQLNIKMGIITNRDQPSLDQHLNFLKIFDFFDLIVPMSQTERHKPYPDPIFYAMKELKITDPKRVLFVGDAQTDIQSGLSANIFTALVPHSMSKQKLTSKPHYMLNSFDDVLSLCYGRGIEIAKDEDLMKEKQKKKQKKDQDQEVEEEEE